METTPGHVPAGFVRVGYRDDLIRLLTEYELEEEDLQCQIATRTPPGPSGSPGRPEYLVHQSLLRSDGEFPCAGDQEAVSFCRQIADEMVTQFGVGQQEAVARVNRHWSVPGDSGRTPRVWIVGMAIAYHETPEFWAHDIYYGHDSRWWAPERALSPPPAP